MGVFRKKTEYGLIMLSHLIRKEQMSAGEMQEVGLPRHFVVKIAQDLIGAGLIGSKEGRGGGYYLDCDPEKVSLREALEALEGPISTAGCTVERGCPFEEGCLHQSLIKEATGEIAGVWDSYRLADLV